MSSGYADGRSKGEGCSRIGECGAGIFGEGEEGMGREDLVRGLGQAGWCVEVLGTVVSMYAPPYAQWWQEGGCG